MSEYAQSMIQQSQERIADIEDPGTWPTAALKCVRQWATEWKGRTGYTTDIGISLELEPSFRRHFDGYRLRAFHFTRLLDHERALILAQGLRPLTLGLVADRINAALAFGAITKAVFVDAGFVRNKRERALLENLRPAGLFPFHDRSP